MEETYTYTARSAEDPDQVVTLTLHDQGMSVDLGVPLERLERAIESASSEGEGIRGLEAGKWLKPTAMSIVQWGTRPFDVVDVDAESDGEGLRMTAWVRMGGLKLVPVSFAMDRVDNPDAARAFIAELDRRKRTTKASTGLPGPLDYWFSWFAAVAVSAVVAAVWLRQREKRKA